MGFLDKILNVFIGNKNQKDIKEINKIIGAALANEPEFDALTLDQLRAKTQEFKEKIKAATTDLDQKIQDLKTEISSQTDFDLKDKLYKQIEVLDKEVYAKQEEVLAQLLPEAFMVVKQTAKRFAKQKELEVSTTEKDQSFSMVKPYVKVQGDKTIWDNSWDAAGKLITWDMVHYQVQLIGGSVLHSGKIAEMQTGEGKTLVSTLPIYLNALTGRGVHVITVNDYLAKRDAQWNAPLFEFHGLTVDCIDNYPPNSNQRRLAYQSDITYGTNNEFGFDYLRDNMADDPKKLVQRELNYAIIDEVDSVLIDDARTPLIISGPVPQGDQQEYDVLKPKIEELVSVQRQMLTKYLSDAKSILKEGSSKEGTLKLFQVYRGLPKFKPLIKFLSEDGIKVQLQKTEAYFMQDNNREMPKVDKDLYFVIDEKNNSIDLTDKGLDFLAKGSNDKDYFILPDVGSEIALIEKQNLSPEQEAIQKDEFFRDYAIKSHRIHSITQLLKAYALFEKDVDYVVMDSQVKIVDEQTGRIMEGRRYSDGLHQALEAKENVKIEDATQTYATVTLQNFFRMYNKLSGMTGTAETEAAEFWEIYKLDVVAIPTNKPILRKDKDDLVYKTNREKYNAIAEEIEKITQEEKRPVLVGTTSVEISELLSRLLKIKKIPHNVLNAKLHKQEAEVVAQAGNPSVVTIATNMAGRGTDIKLSSEVIERGGLAIIGTERHDSRRVDRQLRGRAGRQGDPGSSQFFVSLEDKLMRLFGSERIGKLMDQMGHKEGEVIQSSMITKSIERAQKKVEENNFGVRKNLLEYDDVMNRQREVVYKRRRNALFGEKLDLDIADMIYDIALLICQKNKPTGDFKNFEYELIKFFTMESPLDEDQFKSISEKDLTELVYQKAMEDYAFKTKHTGQTAHGVIAPIFENKDNQFQNIQVPFTDGNKSILVVSDLEKAYHSKGLTLVKDFEKKVILTLIDDHWKEHLRDMDDLRKSVRNASYEQKQPIVVYKEESFHLFKRMITSINQEAVAFLFKGELPKIQPEVEKAVEINLPEPQMQTSRGEETEVEENQQQEPQPKLEPRKVDKIGRNDMVEIINVTDGQAKELKYKQALPLIESGQWIIKN
ncbi:MAG: preprotein translocase subunit SecA [Flavobacteriaceae bacterium]|nr:MAG: preprotein translocase subunit SecA [Flavobacteriaceae bacterium]